ncbi:MAG TPA: glycosyltransferase [Candidatus Limnocylindrales bacterium]
MLGVPYLSVIVELDNVLHGEAARARTMFARLLEQIRENELVPRAEILVMYDETAISATEVHRIVDSMAVGDCPAVELVATQGLGYFPLKNEGGRRAKGEILLFMDSDCLPEAEWLRQLLEVFRRPEADVATGNSYIDRDTFYAKIFAAGWYFPARLPDGPIVQMRMPMANNLAMRRHIFERYPFPHVPSQYMDQGVTWCDILAKNHVPIYLNPNARVAHPPPVFLRSAIVNGHDTALRTREPGETRLQSLKAVYWRFQLNLRIMLSRIRLRYREVGLPRVALPLAIAVAGVYWSLWSLADLVARWAPGLIPHKHLR